MISLATGQPIKLAYFRKKTICAYTNIMCYLQNYLKKKTIKSEKKIK
jgi:hypothetical protein